MRRLALLLAAVLLTGCSAGADPVAEATRGASPQPTAVGGLDGVRFFDELSTLHTEEPVDYPTVPPVGGPHLPRWLACGVYDEPVPDEAAVHSMEHGAVWITHDPSLPEADARALAALAQIDPEYVLVSPYEGLPSSVVASTWGHQLQVESADDPRLAAFTELFAGGDQGGEGGAPCRTSGLTPDEARQALQQSSASS